MIGLVDAVEPRIAQVQAYLRDERRVEADPTQCLQLLAGPGDLERPGGWVGASVLELWDRLELS